MYDKVRAARHGCQSGTITKWNGLGFTQVDDADGEPIEVQMEVNRQGTTRRRAPTFREGLRRVVNGLQPSAFPRLRVNQGVAEDRHRRRKESAPQLNDVR